MGYGNQLHTNYYYSIFIVESLSEFRVFEGAKVTARRRDIGLEGEYSNVVYSILKMYKRVNFCSAAKRRDTYRRKIDGIQHPDDGLSGPITYFYLGTYCRNSQPSASVTVQSWTFVHG